MVCPKCRNAITLGGGFCSNCGAELPPTPPTLAMEARREASAQSMEAGGGDPLAGRVIENKYRLEERIGVGGMGAVYRATRLLIGDTVAVKLMRAEFARDTEAERFRREAQAAARLKHPNAVSIYDFGVTSDGAIYLVMELVEGESLRQIIKREGALEPAAAGEITRQVCAALDEAHQRHIVHRDVKPDNIIVHAGLQGLRVKVLDFGVAKMRDLPVSNLTQTGSVVGTPHYMSPEQCLGEELDHRSDIYSMGIVLYEMLSGGVPFNAPVSTAVVVQHVNQPPPPLREKNSGVPAALERAVLRALEKNREARPQTAGTLAAEVSAALEGRAWSDEVTWDAPPRLAGASGLLAASGERAQTAPRVEPSPSAGAPLALTEVLQTHPSISGQANPVASLQSGAGAKPARVFVIAAALTVVVLALAGLGVWLSRGGSAAGEAGSEKSSNREVKGGESKGGESKGGEVKSGEVKSGEAKADPTREMAYVAGGVFNMGSDDGDEYERPAHRVSVRPFYMDKYEVTCEEYARFLQETEHPLLPAGWRDRSCPPGAARLPVTGVTWDDASAYARWAGKRLPTEEEWEFAARGPESLRYPWGDEWRAGLANADTEGAARGRAAEVGQFGGASRYGVFDLVGNVWEWTASPLVVYPGGRSQPPGAGDFRVIRGGAWSTSRKQATTTYRGYLSRDSRDTDKTGFRCVKDVAQ